MFGNTVKSKEKGTITHQKKFITPNVAYTTPEEQGVCTVEWYFVINCDDSGVSSLSVEIKKIKGLPEQEKSENEYIAADLPNDINAACFPRPYLVEIDPSMPYKTIVQF